MGKSEQRQDQFYTDFDFVSHIENLSLRTNVRGEDRPEAELESMGQMFLMKCLPQA
jgi:hypothetical protein